MKTTMNMYQRFIALSRYARYLDKEQRRETWPETVDRYITFTRAHLKKKFNYSDDKLFDEIRKAIVALEVMPSMRALMTAGPALDRDNICGYNCAYQPVDNVRAFDETMYILMCGTGVGFSVERQYVSKLPEVAEHFEDSDSVISVADSRSGWARGFKELISMLYAGQVPKWDLSKLRPAGARLKTFGGRSSGPVPLGSLFKFTVLTFENARGRHLTSIECHDLMCKIGEVVVAGGVRRSAMISLSNLSDDRMRHAKSGQWWEKDGQRALANNSVAYSDKPDVGSFMREWSTLYESKSGERGIFNRAAARRKVLESGRRDGDYEFGVNPCAEILLRPNQFCNLSEVIIRCGDTKKTLLRKVHLATIIGTFQSTLTDFKYLRRVWTTNTEEERLLGVSLTGIMDNPKMYAQGFDETLLTTLKEGAITANKEMAEELGIPQSTAITCVKPSGTVSQLVDSSSGVHPRYADFFIRTVRADDKDPLTKHLISNGVPHEPAFGQEGNTTVFSFPHNTSANAMVRDELSALRQLEVWLAYKRHWCEHNPSATIQVREDEWMEVGAWVYAHFDEVSGLSFLPYDSGSYRQAPYQEISLEQYLEASELMPDDFDIGAFSEEEDNTIASQELACTGGSCEI